MPTRRRSTIQRPKKSQPHAVRCCFGNLTATRRALQLETGAVGGAALRCWAHLAARDGGSSMLDDLLDSSERWRCGTLFSLVSHPTCCHFGEPTVNLHSTIRLPCPPQQHRPTWSLSLRLPPRAQPGSGALACPPRRGAEPFGQRALSRGHRHTHGRSMR
jgi:hypothetical protein